MDLSHVPGCDFIFDSHSAHTERQHVFDEQPTISQNVPSMLQTDAVTRNRYLRLSAGSGPLRVNDRATVVLDQHSPIRTPSPKCRWCAFPAAC